MTLDGGSPAEVLPGDCRAREYRSPTCGDAELPEPVYRLSFEDNLMGAGAWRIAPRHVGRVGYVDGPVGRAIRLPPSAVVHLPETSRRLRAADALTFAFWIREPGGPSYAKAFLRCRVDGSGFEIYRGAYDYRGTFCIGGYRDGSCAPYAFCHDEGWHHFVLRWDGAGRLETWVDGALGSVAEVPTPGFRVFSFAEDLALGDRAGTGPMSGVIELDEFVVWERALSDGEILAAACPG